MSKQVFGAEEKLVAEAIKPVLAELFRLLPPMGGRMTVLHKSVLVHALFLIVTANAKDKATFEASTAQLLSDIEEARDFHLDNFEQDKNYAQQVYAGLLMDSLLSMLSGHVIR